MSSKKWIVIAGIVAGGAIIFSMFKKAGTGAIVSGPVDGTQFTVSGYIKDSTGKGISGIKVMVADTSGSKNVYTNSTGFYSVVLNKNWTGLITPIKTNYVFTPEIMPVNDLASNMTNMDFKIQAVASVKKITVSGYIKDSYGNGVSNQQIIFTNVLSIFGNLASVGVYTNSAGFYTLSVQEGWSGSIIPRSSTGVLFTPEFINHLNVMASINNQNFTKFNTGGIL